MYFSWAAPSQRAVMATAAVIRKETVGVLLHISTVLQVGILPDMLVVVLVKALYVTVDAWMPDGAENQLCSNGEGQAQDLSQDTWMGETATEAGLIVYLSVLRDT